MKLPKVVTVDFETLPIQGRPDYPPKPVGVSIAEPGKKPHYFAWGHPDGNNSSFRDAEAALQSVWRPNNHILCHNAKFDADVAEVHMGCPRLPALQMHDTTFLLFLRDPHARELALKPAAERWLGEPPTERDILKEWIHQHRKEVEAASGYAYKPSEWGAFIAYAPAHIVGPYANGDTTRTIGLFKSCWRDVITERGMLEAYQREQQVMPIFLDNEREGIRVDLEGLRRDVDLYGRALQAADVWLRKRLRSGDLNIDSDGDFANALAVAGVVNDNAWILTATGQRSVSKRNLTPAMFNDPRVASAFGYRNRLQTCLSMFMLPWLRQAEARGGVVSTNWNQVRGTGGGTRTGRPSTSDPNFLNISKTWDNNDDGYEHPKHLRIDPLPLVRRYMLPDVGDTWLHRDYNGQELRLLAHFEDGPLMAAYRENPWLDVHQHVADLIDNVTGLTFTRKNVKIANFRIIYGGGAPATASGIGCSLEEAKRLLDAHGRALPSIKGRGGLVSKIKALAAAGEPIVTWGGREYFVEPPSFSKKHGRVMSHDYKLLNYECQGSAADVTKQSIINYAAHPKRRGRFLVTVYDENNVSAPKKVAKEEMAVLRECMECVSKELDVPMLSEGKWGETWGSLVKFEEGKSDYE